MGEQTDLRLSVSQIAAELGMARATVSKRIGALGIQPDGKRLGYPVYRLRDVVRVAGDSGSTDENDPAKMKPTDRRAWYQSEVERLRFQTMSGDLLPVDDVREIYAKLVKLLVRSLATLGDRIERDKRVTPDVVTYIENVVAQTRDEIAAEMAREFSES